MIDHKTMCAYSIAIAGDAVRNAQHIIAGDSEPTPQESEAILQLTMMVAGVLEAHAIHALKPRPDLARNVRAFIERLSSDVQRVMNAASPTPTIEVTDAPNPNPPAPPEKEQPNG